MISPDRVPLGLYSPGTSPVHRAPVWLKVVVLAVFLIGTAVFVDTWGGGAACVVVVLAVALAARVPLRILARQLTGPVPILLFVGLLLWWRGTWQDALATVLVLLAAVSAALLLTLTTPVSALMDGFDRMLRPLGKVGVPVEEVSLALTLTLRLIPLQVQMVGEVLDARKARGSRAAGLSLTAFGVPIVVRTIFRSRAVADALRARGAAD
jgi:biotin transport system permease protein